MPAIDKRVHPGGKVTYRVRVRMRGVPTQTKSFKTKLEAKAWGQKVESAIRKGKNFPESQARKRKFEDLVNKYIREVLPFKPKSLEKQTMQLNWWKDQIGDLLLCEVTPAVIAKKRNELLARVTRRGNTRSPSTVNRYLAALSHAFTIAIKEWQWLFDNPVSHISRLKEPRGRDRYLSKEEISTLLHVCSESRNKWLGTIVKLALCTGMRKGEILALTWKDIDFEYNKIYLRETKNNELRVIPVAEIVRGLLNDHLHTKRKGCPYLFPSKDSKKPLDMSRAWQLALKKAEINDFRFQDLRHSCASYLAMAHASTLEIGAILGHKTLAMVRRYSHHSDSSLTVVLNKMNNQLFQET